MESKYHLSDKGV